jgi:hypothetical protein
VDKKKMLQFLLLLLPLFLLFPVVRATIDLTPNLYAHWSLDELNGTNVYDSSGNGRNGTTVNGPLWVAGKLNNSLQFNGVNQYVDMGQIAGFQSSSPFSLEAWFMTINGHTQIIMSKVAGAPQYAGYQLTTDTGGNIYFFLISDYSSANYLEVRSTQTFADGTWHHIIVTYDGSSSAYHVVIYVDDTSISLTVLRDALTGNILNSADFYVAQGLFNYYFNGNLDELAVYNKTLSQGEVDFRWNSGNGTESMIGALPVTTTTTILTTMTSVTAPILGRSFYVGVIPYVVALGLIFIAIIFLRLLRVI